MEKTDRETMNLPRPDIAENKPMNLEALILRERGKREQLKLIEFELAVIKEDLRLIRKDIVNRIAPNASSMKVESLIRNIFNEK